MQQSPAPGATTRRTPVLPPVVRRIRRRRNRGVASFVANRRAGLQMQRNSSRPHRQRIIFFVVLHGTGANLGGNFSKSQFQNAGAFQLFFVRLPRIFPPSSQNLFLERIQRPQLPSPSPTNP